MRATYSYELVPHSGAAGVAFGMSRADVIAHATERGWPLQEDSERGLAYGTNRVGPFVTFESGVVDFIEFRADRELELRYRGVNVFDTPAKDLLALIADHERRLGYTAAPIVESPSKPLSGSTLFCGEIVTLYGAAKQYDYWGDHTRFVFGAVGIGARSYLAASGATWQRPQLPAATNAPRDRHAKFGTATLVGQKDDILELLFEDGVTRKLKARFVERM